MVSFRFKISKKPKNPTTMKKYLLSLFLFYLGVQQSFSCSWYDPDSDYFNLFVQELVQEEAYYPFLFTLNSSYYGDDSFYENNQKKAPIILDENIENWVSYFQNELSYEETNALVKIIDRKHLYNWKKGKLSHELSKKMGADFYHKYQEGLAYLAYAKYLAPYMMITYVPSNNWYSERSEDDLDVSKLDYNEVLNVLTKSYDLTDNQDIKLRYAYQIVRLNHYSRKYNEAIAAFNKYTEPLKKDTPMYWYALDQMAGAQRGLGMLEKANQNFFQVFIHSRNKKKSAHASMRLNDWDDFEMLLKNAKTKEEKNMAYFLLAYNDFSNPVYFMNEMLKIDANSDILKVLTVRALDQLERNHLPVYFQCNDDECTHSKRLPLKDDDDYYSNTFRQLNDLKNIIKTAQKSSKDEFWSLSLAHIHFLEKDYENSTSILKSIKTNNTLYQKQINQMLVLNHIVAQPKIDAAFESKIFSAFPGLFKTKGNSQFTDDARDFIRDILANRYFLQNDLAKSFLMSNQLSALQYNPNLKLTQQLDDFIQKSNKNAFEQWLVSNQNDMGDIQSFFALIYGDHAMRNADFDKAVAHYQKAQKFNGIQRDYYLLDRQTWETADKLPKTAYNGFNNISNYIFGQEKWVSYQSPAHISLKVNHLKDFPFLKDKMNKLELAQALQALEKIGKGKDSKAMKANELIGNVLFNTSKLGYFRHVFVMDLNNANGPKFEFNSREQKNQLYYKYFTYYSYIEDDNYDLTIQYYQKALTLSNDREKSANIIFQMAKAEQGKYYIWKGGQNWYIDWNDPDYRQKQFEQEDFQLKTKRENYRNYFAILKRDYANTQTVNQLQKSCSYFSHYMLY